MNFDFCNFVNFNILLGFGDLVPTTSSSLSSKFLLLEISNIQI